MSYYFLSERYERDYVLFLKVEKDLEYASPDAIHAMHPSHKFDNRPEVRYSTPHITAAIIELHLNYKLVSCSTHHSKAHNIHVESNTLC